MTGWLVATQARAGLPDQARTLLAALEDEQASSGEIRNARAVICLADSDPAGALGALHDVLDGTAPVLGYVTVVEAHLLAGLAHRELGDQRAANQAAEQALALAESDRVILPFAMTGSAGLLEALPRHQTAHAALLADILDVLHGSSPAAKKQSSSPPPEDLSPGELRVLRYLPTNLSRPEIAAELSVSPNTVSAHIRSIYAKLGVRDRSSAVRRARELRLLAAGRTRYGRLPDLGDACPAPLRADVLRFVTANLGDPGLSVVGVCRRFAISPRLLHRLFEAQEHTFAETVRTMRLEQCARLLADPLNRSTITDIAVRYGFTDSASFSRAFRRSFGIALREMREQSRGIR